MQAMDELDLSAFRYGGANLTGFRLVDRENSQLVRNVHTAWKRLGAAYRRHLPAGNLLKVIIIIIITIIIIIQIMISYTLGPMLHLR